MLRCTVSDKGYRNTWVETSKAFGSGKAGKVAQKGLCSKCSVNTGTMEEKP